MDAEQMSRAALRIDAAYCALTGAATMALARPLGERLGLAPALLRGVGALEIGWSGTLVGLSTRERWRATTAAVGAANLAGALFLFALGVSAEARFARWTYVLVGADVAAFSSHQLAVAALGVTAHDEECA